jgi:hypothetical protein
MVALPKATRLLRLRVQFFSTAWTNVSYERCVAQVEASVTGRSLVQGNPTECVCFVQCDHVKQHHHTDPQRVGRSGRTKNIP